MLIYTGMRPSALCGLRVRHLDMLKGAEHVCETLTPVGSGLVPGTTKTDQERVIPLPHFVTEPFAAHLAGRVDQLGRPLRGDEYVFTDVKGTPLNRDFLRKGVLVPALRAAGLYEDFRTTTSATPTPPSSSTWAPAPSPSRSASATPTC